MWKHSRGCNIRSANSTFTWDPLITGHTHWLTWHMRICEDAGQFTNLRWDVKPELPRAPNRNRKCYGKQVISSLSLSLVLSALSLSPGLHISHLCVSLCIWFLPFLCKSFLCLSTHKGQGLPPWTYHCLSDHIPDRVWQTASSPYAWIPGKKIYWHHSCWWTGFQLCVPMERESHLEETSCQSPELCVYSVIRGGGLQCLPQNTCTEFHACQGIGGGWRE